MVADIWDTTRTDNSQFRQLQPSMLKTSGTNTMTETETKTMTTKLQRQ